MLRLSFRWVSNSFVPGADTRKRALVAAATVALAACGGGGNAHRLVAGTGYTFEAPKAWEIVRTARQVQAAQGHGSVALVGVSRFPLLRPFRPALWPKVVGELDGAADAIARQQHGSVTSAQDVTFSGQRGRRYKVAYDLRGRKLIEELAFVLRGKTEYLLLCRYDQNGSHSACDALMSSFALA
jgi:hypothetical protein